MRILNRPGSTDVATGNPLQLRSLFRFRLIKMSSLAATQADGYYLPPDYFDSGAYKKKSKNEFAGSKGHNQFVAKVRFALKFY